jgi:cytosine/adenosine deaminase-related metal-dependent hydrolase
MSRLVLRGARWPGEVAVEDGRIAAVGTVPEAPGDQVMRVDGDIVTAGLVNTHHHFYQWMTRGRAVGCDLFGWLTELYPVWARLSAEDVHTAAKVALAELALTGCTTAADHHYVVPGGDDSVFDAIADAARTVGIRVHLARGSMDLGESKETIRVLETNLEAIDRAIAQCREALEADPSSVYLNTYLAETRRRKLELLRRATALVDSRS